MSDSTLSQSHHAPAPLTDCSAPPLILHPTNLLRWVEKLVVATWLLMAVGSATRVLNAGLACPDWPLCYGQAIPWLQMNLQVFLEWFHRVDAGFIGLGTVGLCARAWWQRRYLPFWLPLVTTVSLILIVLQVALGAFTVTELLRFDIVTAHLGTALLFFVSLVAITVGLRPPLAAPASPWLVVIGLVTVVAVYLQSLLGALVGSQWALHQCFGYNQLCAVMNSHLLGVIPTTGSVLLFLLVLWRTAPREQYLLRKLGWIVAGLLILQIGLGVATYFLHLQVAPLTVFHQAIGALLLGTLVFCTGISTKSLLASS